MSKKTITSRSYYSNADIASDVRKINAEENLRNLLSTYRLACTHRELGRQDRDPNIAIANLRIKFISTAGKEIEYSIPISVFRAGKRLTCFSGSNFTEEDFLKFYKQINPAVQSIDRRSHYHSEPFLAYSLLSDEGIRFLLSAFAFKGIIAFDEDDNSCKSNVKDIIGVAIDLHSSKVVCFNCYPFLQKVKDQILNIVYWCAAQGEGILPIEQRKVKEIEFNVSANFNFNWSNISNNKTFDHIPVLEKDGENILTRTSQNLTPKEEFRQRVGELACRTFFVSGSSSLQEGDLEIISQDRESWSRTIHDAAKIIQQKWRSYQKDKKVDEELSKAAYGVLKLNSDNKIVMETMDGKVIEITSQHTVTITGRLAQEAPRDDGAGPADPIIDQGLEAGAKIKANSADQVSQKSKEWEK